YARTNQAVDFQHRQAEEPAPIRIIENAGITATKTAGFSRVRLGLSQGMWELTGLVSISSGKNS
ncbi:MAG: hypothetical protein KDA51_09310, partial [Planctomycetales bacterium]|nr:hypothetical protein [Planctomycetales bacterium]